MKKKVLTMVMAAALALGLLTGCAEDSAKESSAALQENTADAAEAAPAAEEVTAAAETSVSADEEIYDDSVTVRVGGLKGPTSIGTLFLKQASENGQTGQKYEFNMAAAADVLLPMMIKGELDIALIPANVAATLYNKTEGGISVIDINTLGVLYMVSGDNNISTPADLKGKTIILTGKGTTPDYVLHYVLSQNGISDEDVTLEYKSEATEVAAYLAENPQAIGLLPQPFVTAACIQNEALQVVMDMTEQWDMCKSTNGSKLVTGVTVVRNDFLNEHPDAVTAFLNDHADSVESLAADLDTGAALAVEAEIIGKEPIAKKAIPQCNIVCITGNEMKDALSGYLEVLFNQDPSSVGGTLPNEDFYHLK